MKFCPWKRALSLTISGGAIASLLVPVRAQDQDQTSSSLDRIRVTGSRIRRADIESASPVFVIQREEIERTGLTSVGELLQDLPIAGSALNTQFNNGGNGQSQINLRNLGVRRVLLLMNGRRFSSFLGTSGNQGVDLNNIPLTVVKRIEILKDGASSIYGSDAIAGVVNIITRNDFEGFQANAYLGQFGAGGDGDQQAYDFSLGATAERGSLFLNASYVKADPVLAGDRLLSSEPRFGTGFAFGSSATPQGLFAAAALGDEPLTVRDGADVQSEGVNAFRPGDFALGVPGLGQDRYNFAPFNYLVTPQTRRNIFTQGVFDLTGDLKLSLEAQFNNRQSSQLLAPTPLFLGLFGTNLGARTGIAADNAFNPFGVELSESDGFFLGRRLVEAGPRIFRQDVDLFRFSLAVDGALELKDRYLDWQLAFTHSDIDQSDRNSGRVNMQRVGNALSGAPCRDDVTGDGCVELNLFGGQGPQGEGTITPAMLSYLLYSDNESFGSTLNNLTANVAGRLLTLPAGSVGFALGLERRQEKGFDSPDPLVAAGLTSGTARQPTSGDFEVDEVYLELAVPLLTGLTGARRLDLSLSSRWSSYDTFGQTLNSKLGIQWQPLESLLLRATFSEGFRAPSIGELFGGRGDGFPQLIDPCNGIDTDGDGQADRRSEAPGCSNVPADYSQASSQIRITQGANPELQPETANTFTAGFVYSPGWSAGLDITVDYYNIQLDNAIATIGAQTILNTCAASGTTFCDLLSRTSSGAISELLDLPANSGTARVEGVDMLLSYSFAETDWGFFRLVLDGAYQGENSRVLPAPDGQSVRINSLGQSKGDQAYVRWKGNLDLNWSYRDWEATYGLNFIHSSLEDCGVPAAFGLCNVGVDTNGDGRNDTGTRDRNGDGLVDGADLARRIGSVTYHDTQLSYYLDSFDTRVSLGVNNLWNKGPPLSTIAFVNSFNVADYRVPGRFGYFRVTVDF
ncbi:MAG: TonB-dependent receptor [Pseudomonadota bacterium]